MKGCKVNERVKIIYAKLYKNSSSCTKEILASEFSVTIKTIENTLKPYLDDEIVYDKKLKRYRFNTLLPKYIPYKVFLNLFENSINYKFLREDFFIIDNLINITNDLFMIDTTKLSEMSKKIIMFTLAINDNCVLKVEYAKNAHGMEIKYIKPRKVLSNSFTYFCYVTYDERNGKDINQTRTFKFQNMGKIESIKYATNEIFKQDKQGNIFGEYQRDKYVTLILDKVSGSFFRSSDLFNNPAYEIIDEYNTIENNLGDTKIKMKMYFNNLEIEVIKIIQQWMPHIKIDSEDPLKNEIEKIIIKNLSKFI